MFMLMHIVLHWVIAALVLMLVSAVVPGVVVEGLGAAILAAFILAIVNAIIRPVVMLLTLPINILTLGLFLLVVNASGKAVRPLLGVPFWGGRLACGRGFRRD